MPHSFRWWQPVAVILGVVIVSGMFAMVEIQIEGAAGWAANLPTWRIEKHWLLDIFWGGRAMTGYHAWVFPFIGVMLHMGFVLLGTWSWRLEARALAATMLFWIIEDALWFILNPAYGWFGLTPERVPWHKHWFLGVPLDYWTFTSTALVALAWSYGPWRRNADALVAPVVPHGPAAGR